MKKHEVLALLEELPHELNADELLFVLTLTGEIERAEAACAAESEASPSCGAGRRPRLSSGRPAVR
jgi:hypothetical protein